jgi:hypothetical protein
MNAKPATIEDEARARITWGEPPERVFDHLKSSGWGEADAAAFVAQLQRERVAQVRGDGLVKMLWGLGLIGPAFAMLLLGYSIWGPWETGGDLVLCLWGLHKIVQGIIMLTAPRTEKGDLSDPYDEK